MKEYRGPPQERYIALEREEKMLLLLYRWLKQWSVV